MTMFYSPSRNAFYDDAVHGPRTIEVVDEARLAELRALCDEEGGESDACAELALGVPMTTAANPSCQLPDDAAEISREEYEAVFADLQDGKVLANVDGRPAAIERELSLDEQLAQIRLRRDRALANSDWTQVPDALTAAKRKLWAEHRKALRDLPAMVEKAAKAGHPVDSVPFPTPPS